jgi:hypothetical protein
MHTICEPAIVFPEIGVTEAVSGLDNESEAITKSPYVFNPLLIMLADVVVPVFATAFPDNTHDPTPVF